VFWIVQEEAHILNIAVRPELRGKGIGKKLLEFSLGVMEEAGVVEVLLEVRRSNEAATRMYEDFGFEEIFTRKDYYGDEDAVVMRLEFEEGLI
ncbi:MAG: ribosomal protein S18-alanine N-acetyltransferase, partial [Thermodesulfobacteriota bacterium]